MLNGYPTMLHKHALLHYVPDDWKLSRIGKVCKIRNTLRKPLSEEERQTMQGSFPYYGPTSQVDSISEYRLDGTYALIGEDGDHFLKYDRMSMTQFITGKSNVNNHAHILEGTSACLTEWVFHFFRHRNILHFLSRQGAGRYKLNKAALERLPILLPPIPEQKKIATILSTWDQAIELTEKLIAAKQKRKQALMQQILTGKMRFVEFAQVDRSHDRLSGALRHSATAAKLPRQWTLLSLDELGKFASGGTPSKSNENYWNGDIPWISAKDLKSFYLKDSIDKITEAGADNGTRLVPAGTILILVRGMTLLKDVPIGFTTKPMTFNQDVRALCIHDRFDAHFIAYSLVSRKAQLMSQVNLAGHGTGRLATELLQAVSISIPKSLTEQQKIAAFLSKLDREIELEQSKACLLRKQKKGLMQQLLSGKVRVNVDAEIARG